MYRVCVARCGESESTEIERALQAINGESGFSDMRRLDFSGDWALGTGDWEIF